MKAFLTGATGFVGGHLLDALLAAGAEVRCLVRPSSSRRNLEGRKVELVEGDLRHPQTLAAGLAGCEALFHCAADYRLYSARPRELYESNVEGTRNILRAAAAAGIERVVYTSSVGALGLRHDGRPADETTPSALADMVGHYKRIWPSGWPSASPRTACRW
jgi:dihydroflavonol-4-reductase